MGEASAPEAAGSTRRLTYRLANALTWAISQALWFLDGSKWAETSPYLSGNFAPTTEERFDEGLEVVEGELPAALAGAFVRVGPNPRFLPGGRYHWFDGDGMAHCVRIKAAAPGGAPAAPATASYSGHLVRTSRLAQEEAAGYAVFTQFGDFRGLAGLAHIMLGKLKDALGVTSGREGRGTANTALAFHAGRLLALNEGDLPYALRVACEGLVDTIGRVGFGGGLTHAFTAHPKVDPVTGELFFFGYSVTDAPYCRYSYADQEGRLLGANLAIDLPAPVMMHDCAITESRVIFLDMPLLFKPEEMVKSKTLPFLFDRTRPARFGVLPRYARPGDEPVWFSVDPMMAFHTANAWDEGDSGVKLYLCTFKDFSLSEFTAAGDEALPRLTEVTMDLATGEATVRRVAELPGDFPQVPASRVGRPCRYVYMAAMRDDKGVPLFYGISKIDLASKNPDAAVAGLVEHGPGRLGGEAYFVPGGRDGAEDDGYLVTYVYDDTTGASEFVAYDARTMSSTPVARVALPGRVPHGFHCLWVSEAQLASQAAATLAVGDAARVAPAAGGGGLISGAAQPAAAALLKAPK